MEPLETFLMLFGSGLMLSFFAFLFVGPWWGFVFAESILVGGIWAHGLAMALQSLQVQALDPLFAGALWPIIPLFFGLISFARYTSYRWIARYTTSIQSGVGLGVAALMTMRADVVGIIQKAITGVTESSGWTLTMTGTDIFSAIIWFIGVVCTVSVFLYSKKFSKEFFEGRLHWVPKIGRLFLYIAIGSRTGFRQPTNVLVISIRRTLIELGLGRYLGW